MKTGAIGGAEYRKHKNWCHQWSRVPKTGKLVSSVEQSNKIMKTQFLCFRYSAPPMTPVFMFLVLCSTDDTSFYVLGILLHR
jgi:hypothetical protein